MQAPINLTDKLRLNIIVLKELENQLIHVQERIEYFQIENDNKNSVLFEKVKEIIDENFNKLKILLQTMNVKYLNINKEQKTKSSKLRYEYLPLIKDDCDKCRDTILKILSMIPEV